jgi:DNA-binding transcriptional LysR family regulator
MEIFELRYFLAVAKNESIHRASEYLSISPGSLSKAIARLEEELQVKLFHREGRHIKITDQGRLLQKRASEIIHLEESAKTELSGHKGGLHVIITGSEIFLAHFGLAVSLDVKKKYPNTTFEYLACDDQKAIERIQKGEAHLAIVSSDVPPELNTKLLGQTTFKTYIGPTHEFYQQTAKGKTISVEEVLKKPFVSPNNPLLGAVGFKQSLDGWRDDKFPRKIDYLASSLKLLEQIVTQGLAIAYLPDYLAKPLNLKVLEITGCPYSCSQKIKLVTRNPKEISWINQVF